MKQRITLAATLAAILAAAIPTAAFAGMPEDVKAINDGWAHITYQMTDRATRRSRSTSWRGRPN